jgi:FkbM family methyltransferase
MTGRVWESQTIEFMTTHCGNGDVVHAGTYFGDFLPALAKACGPEARIWAFEPNSENYRCASITVDLNGLRNVVLANAGLGAAPTRLPLTISDTRGVALGGRSKFAQSARPSDGAATELVEVLRVDDVVPPNRLVSLVQLDVEGFEEHALTGAMETIRRWRPLLILETLPRPDWMARELAPLGYISERRINKNFIVECRQ